MTNNQESNSGTSIETNSDKMEINSLTNSELYISEDALLEQPTIQCNKKLEFNEDPKSKKYDETSGEKSLSCGSIVDASVSTVPSTFSGLEDNDLNLSKSVPTIDQICVQMNDTFEQDCMKICNTGNNCTPEKCIPKPADPNVSPDLFSDEEEESVLCKTEENLDLLEIPQFHKVPTETEHVLRNDKKLLRHVQEQMKGVLPPPSVTILQVTAEQLLNKIRENEQLFTTSQFIEEYKSNSINNSDGGKEIENRKKLSLLISNTYNEVQKSEWPKIINLRYHGLMYNRGKISEEFEDLCSKYCLRYVGAETASTCSLFSSAKIISPSKRKSQFRWPKSPGRRLSHLARRRITFSSSTLQSNSRQILIDSRKSLSNLRAKSPRKSTPRKSPRKKVRTPGSSSKKFDLSKHLSIKSEHTSTSRASSTKRALFQSPSQDCNTRPSTSSSGKYKKSPRKALFISPSKNEIVEIKKSPKKQSKNLASTSTGGRKTPKKRLFSPGKTLVGDSTDKKRKRNDSVGECHPNKICRSMSFDVHNSREIDSRYKGNLLMRRHNSDVSLGTSPAIRGDLSEMHKKKLLWAVAEALKSQKISLNHPQFKGYASTLARVTRRFMPDLLSTHNGPRLPGSTSERMLKIARQCVYQVIKGKTVDEIIQNATNEQNSINSMKVAVLNSIQTVSTGYVNIRDKENINTINSSNTNVDKDKLRIRRNINFEEKNNLDTGR